MSANNGKPVLPPHDSEAERALLGSLLRTPNIAREVTPRIRAEDFYEYGHGKVFLAILELHVAGNPIDHVTVSSKMQERGWIDDAGGFGYVVELFDAAPCAEHYLQYISTITERARRRGMATGFADLQHQALDLSEPIEQVLKRAQQQIERLIAAGRPEQTPESWEPVYASGLANQEALSWLWQGWIARHGITLFSALMKAGKTTLLSHLIRNMREGVALCDYEVAPARVLYISEESQSQWVCRRDALGIGDHAAFICRPFRRKPSMSEWERFLDHVAVQAKAMEADLIVFDTLSALWPIREENDAGEVQAGLMPLWNLTPYAAILLVHHLRKGDGAEGTGSRGSGALLGFVDTIVELRRDDPHDVKTRRRRLNGFARNDGTPAEIVIELDGVSGEYRSLGSPKAAKRGSIQRLIFGLLPLVPPGITAEEITDAWPADATPTKTELLDALREGADQRLWIRTGEGRKGDPYRFHVASPPP